MPAGVESLWTLSRVPYVVDYDDAIFHRYDQHRSRTIRTLLGKKIDAVMRQAAWVVAGNSYLAERARAAGAGRVDILPTAVDIERYPFSRPVPRSFLTIGWIGSPATAHYLESIRPALREICARGEARLVAVGSKPLDWPEVPVEVKPWKEATEVQDLCQFDLGIMPLRDSAWERGKCGLKLIQYMAAGRPVVGSPVGVNRQIIVEGQNGFQATTHEEWVRALQNCIRDPVLRTRMGEKGREMVRKNYCIQVTAPRLVQILQEARVPTGKDTTLPLGGHSRETTPSVPRG